jgi:LmbE family N-acetylglucosaminyl deacetylase
MVHADVLQPSRALFVQPHTDDVALSCGSLVARLADAGESPVVIGVFVGAPPADQPLSPQVLERHAKLGLGDQPWLARQQEDATACEILAATPMWLEFSDVMYRPGSLDAIFGPMDMADPLIASVAGQLLACWRETRGAVMYLPLGIGGHIDHRICHEAGALLEAAGVPVRYYEDFPYAAFAGVVSARLAQVGPCEVEIIDATAWIERRVRACDAYASQMRAIFGPSGLIPGTCEDAVRRHASTIARGLPGFMKPGPQFAECYFRRVSRPDPQRANGAP